jgi:putrescine transport system substrate-binding protein
MNWRQCGSLSKPRWRIRHGRVWTTSRHRMNWPKSKRWLVNPRSDGNTVGEQCSAPAPHQGWRMVSTRSIAIATLCVSTSLLISCGRSNSPAPQSQQIDSNTDDKVVNLYFVSDYLAPDTIAKFEAKTGIKVHISYFDNNETLEARMLAGHSGYDVALPTSGTFKRQIASGAYLPLDRTQIPNAAHLDAAILSSASASDPDNAHSLVYAWGTYGIVMNKNAVIKLLPKVPLTSWRLIFDPAMAAKLATCGINFIDDPVGIVQLALNYLRKDPHTVREQDFTEVERLLLAVRPYVRNIDTSSDIEALANGDICIALTYNGDFVQASRRAQEAKNGIQLAYLIPQEGSLLWFDLLAVPHDAPHIANAYQLINYLMEPKVIADVTNFIGFANANSAAMPFLDPSIASNEAIYPTAEGRRRLFVQTEVSPEQSRTITRLWQKFKTGQ